jgi:hypothetical protein
MDHSLPVEFLDGGMDRLVERGEIGEGLMGEVMRLEIVPDDLDVIEFGRVFGQPFDCEPVCPGRECARESLLTWIGPLSSTSTTCLAFRPGMGPYS